jgi:hypothetical protein
LLLFAQRVFGGLIFSFLGRFAALSAVSPPQASEDAASITSAKPHALLPSFNLLEKAQRYVILENFSHPKMLLAKQILQKNLSGISKQVNIINSFCLVYIKSKIDNQYLASVQ